MAVQLNYNREIETADTVTIVAVPAIARGVINRIIVNEKTSIGGAFSFDVFDRDVTGMTEAQRTPFRLVPRTTASSQANFNNDTVAGGHGYNYAYALPSADTAQRNLYVVINAASSAARTYNLAMTITDPII